MADISDYLTFGPYLSGRDALGHITAFHMRAFPGQRTQDWGVVWCEGGEAVVLRPPVLDSDHEGLAVVYEWTGPVPAPMPKSLPNQGGRKSITSHLQDFFGGLANSAENSAIDDPDGSV